MTDERYGAMRHGADVTLARVRAHGVANGSAAAADDSPDFLSYQLLLTRAWETSCERLDVQSLAEQEEYFIGWVHGYVGRADEMECAPDTWEEQEAAE